MIYNPEDVLTVGTNTNYSLAEVYYYLPSYIEYMIEYWQDFEIDVDEFYSLGKSIKEINQTNDNSEGFRKFARIANQPHKGSVKHIIDLPANKKVEFNYEFTKRLLEILDSKKNGKYIAPPYKYYEPEPVSKLNIKDFIKKKDL